MKITIKVTEKEAKHLQRPHTFMDECYDACQVLYKVQKQINKKLQEKERRNDK